MCLHGLRLNECTSVSGGMTTTHADHARMNVNCEGFDLSRLQVQRATKEEVKLQIARNSRAAENGLGSATATTQATKKTKTNTQMSR